MKHLLLIGFLCAGTFGAPICLRGQSTPADSLAHLLLTAAPDTHRVTLMVDYAWEINESKTLEASKVLREAIALAQRLNFSKGESAAWNGLGVAFEILDSIPKAIEYYQKALAIRRRINDKMGIASQHNNLGNAYEMLGDYDKSLVERRESLRIVEELGDSSRIARAHLNLGSLFETIGLYPEAYEQTNAARQIFEQKEDSESLAKVFTALGHIRFELEMIAESRSYYTKALDLYKRLGDREKIASGLSDLGNALDEMGDMDSSRLAISLYKEAISIRREYEDEAGVAALYNNLGVANKHLGNFAEGMQWLQQALEIWTKMEDQPSLMVVYNSIGDVLFGQKKYREAFSYTNKYAQIATENGDEKYIQKSYKDFAKIYAALGNWQKAYEYRKKYDEYRYSRLDEARARDFVRKEVLFNDGRRQREIDRQQLELQQAQTRAWLLIGGALALAMLAGLLYNRNRLRARTNRELATKNIDIQRERERADSLLKNILPEKTAQELKLNNTVQPVRYEAVTVLFSDFKNFTRIGEQLSPEDLVAELDRCFRFFDDIIDKYGLEKIKTIGDAYMCAGGLPEPNKTHAIDTVNAAIEMQQGLKTLMQKNIADGKPVFEMRIGIHSGPVVAGVVGSRKFAYDIWGDTVNTAARLEHGSEAGKINISQTTWEEVQQEFNCTFRGRLAAKNKGEIAMYFVDAQQEA